MMILTDDSLAIRAEVEADFRDLADDGEPTDGEADWFASIDEMYAMQTADAAEQAALMAADLTCTVGPYDLENPPW